MYFIYILLSAKDRRTYVGYSKDINNRLAQHNAGQVDATKHRRPLELFFESFKTQQEVKKRELYWKSGVGRRKMKYFFA